MSVPLENTYELTSTHLSQYLPRTCMVQLDVICVTTRRTNIKLNVHLFYNNSVVNVYGCMLK